MESVYSSSYALLQLYHIFFGKQTLFLQLFEGTLGSSALSDAVIPSNSFESSFTKHLHCHTHTSTISQLFWFPANQ
jgi:hypothetical protein